MATVLREGPDKHSGKDYYLSIEVLKMSEFAKILSDVAGWEISMISSPGGRNYMESAQITMELTRNEKFKEQNELNDDVLTVVGRLETKMKDWAMEYFEKE